MKIQIVSDLHLEFRGKKINDLLIPSAPILCMVGDICVCGDPIDFAKFINFLNYFYTKFEAIIHIAGNHEYYTNSKAPPKELAENTMTHIDKKLKQLNKQYANYHYLNNTTWEYVNKKTKKPYIFVGTTLWSYIPHNVDIYDKDTKKTKNINLYNAVEQHMNDYNYIYVAVRDPKIKMPYRQYRVSDMQKKYKAAVSFLKKVISSSKESKKTYILLTHHKPLFDRDTDKRDEYTYAYESDLANVLLVRPFVAAAHGHTHIHYDKKINGVRVVSNPKGYLEQDTNYNDKFTIQV